MSSLDKCINGPKLIGVKEIDLVTDEIFQEIRISNKPALLKNCKFGPCMQKWNLQYLREKLNNCTITIHESQGKPDLNFLDKNFQYKRCGFDEFADKLLLTNSYVYLRSTHQNGRAKIAARIEDDFPALADDLKPPEFIPFKSQPPTNNKLYHSSVLRIASAGVQIWTHFDLCDNVLVQVVGTKRILLIPPQDTRYLYVVGDKSRVNCFDDWSNCLRDFPLVKNARLYHCLLEPGDGLFIPSLWWHNIRAIDLDSGSSFPMPNYSIGFNIFWKDSSIDEMSLYAEGDIYGNKNLVPYESALGNLEKLVQHLNKLPGKYNEFYKQLLLERLKQKLFPNENIEANL